MAGHEPEMNKRVMLGSERRAYYHSHPINRQDERGSMLSRMIMQGLVAIVLVGGASALFAGWGRQDMASVALLSDFDHDD